VKGYIPGKAYKYEIETTWTSGEVPAGNSGIKIPAKVCAPGRTYRARVRYKDETGRWSHWSPPHQFVTSAP